METKINNVKEFAIGTKIEYMNKLYLVVAQTYCDNCSIANICSNNDKTSGNNITGVLSRDKRISIFGECSSIVRSDGKSVAFKEIHENIPEIDNNIVKPLYAGSNKLQLRPVEFDIPEGFIIDTENSDLAKGIIKFKNKWLTLEQLYKLARENNHITNRDAIKHFTNIKLVALANLMDIARYFNGDWNYRIRGDNGGYMIAYDKTKTTDDGYQVVHINSDTDMYFGNIMFKNEADAKYVIDNPNFRTILDKIFKV